MIRLALAGAVLATAAAVYVARSVPRDEAVLRGLVAALVTGLPIVSGAYALRARHTARFGLILLATGFAWSLTALAESPHSLPYSLGRVAAWLVFPSVLYLMLAFPDGRIGPGPDRMLLWALNFLLWALFVGSALFVERYPTATPWATCDRDCPANAFLVLEREPAVMDAVVQPLRELLTLVLLAAVLLAMARRWRTATRLRRRMTRPVSVATATSTLLLAAFFVARWASAGAAETVGLLWALSLAGIAAAFGIGLLRRRLLVSDIVGTLAGRLGGKTDLTGIRSALSATLDDPSLELLVRAGPSRWCDAGGHPARLPAADGGSAVTLVRDDAGTDVAAIVHDAGLAADEELLAAVSALVLACLQHQHVTTQLSGATSQLEQSRRRIAGAADHERARIERDLHDGAQQRLLALRIRLSLAEELLVSDPAAGAEAVHALGAEVDRTLSELRELAQGVYPAILKERGLGGALQSLARESPLPVQVQAAGVRRHPPELEIAVYFTCAEALHNAVTHARSASGVWVALREGRELTFEVRDDGAGFTPPVGDAGPGHRGLRNMRDRVEAIGGRLSIVSSPGHGTRVTGAVPL